MPLIVILGAHGGGPTTHTEPETVTVARAPPTAAGPTVVPAPPAAPTIHEAVSVLTVEKMLVTCSSMAVATTVDTTVETTAGRVEVKVCVTGIRHVLVTVSGTRVLVLVRCESTVAAMFQC